MNRIKVLYILKGLFIVCFLISIISNDFLTKINYSVYDKNVFDDLFIIKDGMHDAKIYNLFKLFQIGILFSLEKNKTIQAKLSKISKMLILITLALAFLYINYIVEVNYCNTIISFVFTVLFTIFYLIYSYLNLSINTNKN